MWPFTRKPKPPAALRNDVFWLRDDARLHALVLRSAEHLTAGLHVLLVAHSPERIDQLADAIAGANLPLDGLDSPATAHQLLSRLRSQPTPTVLLALSGSLDSAPAPHIRAPQPASNAGAVAMLITERYPLRPRDDALVAFGVELNAASIEFHICIQDPLLRPFRSEQTIRILKSLGMADNDHIEAPMLSNSVRRAQDQVARKCPDPANVISWLQSQAPRL